MKLTETQIENGIFEAIRLAVVAAGYLPDITTYINDLPGYEAAIKAIKDANKNVIYVENSGSYKSRERLRDCSFIIDKEDADPSVTGTKSIPEYELDEDNDNYKKTFTADGLFDMMYRVTMIAYDTEYTQIMSTILLECLGFRKVMNAIDSNAATVGQFNLWRRNFIKLDGSKFLERAVMYEIPSVDLIGNTDAGTVSRAVEITIGVTTNTDTSEADGVDDITVIIT